MENIDTYYKAVRLAYNEIEAWRLGRKTFRHELSDWIVLVLIVLTFFSVVPVLPAILTLIGKQFPVQIAFIDTSQATFASFGILWLTLVVVFVILLIPAIYINLKIDPTADEKNRPKHTLSAEQFTFLRTYEAHAELKTHFATYMDQNIEKALQALRKILPRVNERLQTVSSMPAIFAPFGGASAPSTASDTSPEYLYWTERDSLQPPGRQRSNLQAQIAVARTFLSTFGKYAWFELGSTTKLLLGALVLFPERVLTRLERREDLPEVLDILNHFMRFTYAFLPEHSANRPADELTQLHSAGRKSLDEFVSKLAGLSELPPDTAPATVAEGEKESLRSRVSSLYVANILIRFLLWLLLMLLLSTVGVLAFNTVQPLDPDTMATIVVGGSITSAAALTVFPPRRSGG